MKAQVERATISRTSQQHMASLIKLNQVVAVVFSRTLSTTGQAVAASPDKLLSTESEETSRCAFRTMVVELVMVSMVDTATRLKKTLLMTHRMKSTILNPNVSGPSTKRRKT